MKTKLLRKVRKEFKIEYYPNGIENLFERPVISVSGNMLRDRYFIIQKEGGTYIGVKLNVCRTKEEAILSAKMEVLNIVRGRHPHLGSYRKKFTKQQIWP